MILRILVVWSMIIVTSVNMVGVIIGFGPNPRSMGLIMVSCIIYSIAGGFVLIRDKK